MHSQGLEKAAKQTASRRRLEEPIVGGQQRGNPSQLEHENIENIHSEWTSVVSACPEPILPSPGNNASFFLQQAAHLYCHLVALHPRLLADPQVHMPIPFTTVTGSRKGQWPKTSQQDSGWYFLPQFLEKRCSVSLQLPSCWWKPGISRSHHVEKVSYRTNQLREQKS